MADPMPYPSRRIVWRVLAVVFAFHVLGSWSFPLLDRDEPRFAEASREMLERSDFVVPYFNNKYRFDKPPLIYWMQTACYRAFGINEFAARLPAALAAALTAVVTLLFGSRLFGARAGLWAALLLSVTAQMVMHGKAAVADMPMVFAFTLALWAGWEVLMGRERGGAQARWWLVFAAALGLGFLAKGPLVWLAIPPLAICALRGGIAGRGFWLALAGSLLLSLVIVSAWAIPALLRTDGQYFNIGIGKHVVSRSLSAMEGHGGRTLTAYLVSLPFYVLVVFVNFLPASILLPFLARRVWKRAMPTRANTYLVLAVLTVVVVFSLIWTKLPHYILPAFPPLALLVVGHWLGAGRPEKRLGRLIKPAVIVWLAVFFVGAPLARPYFPSVRLAELAEPHLSPDMEFGVYGYAEPSLVFYFRKHIRGFMTWVKPEEVEEYMARPGRRFVIVRTDSVERIGAKARAAWTRLTMDGFNIGRSSSVALTMFLKKDP